ncbi:MAG: protein-glutamate O-methyltransferase CheR [Rubripirellula sp.]|nr:protein-glutamate O-methyltransferase CheR [Rubripirellula sp.]
MNEEKTAKMNLSPDDFGLLQSLLSQRVGISLAAGKEYLVVNRLSPLVDSFQFDSLHGLIQSLERNADAALWDEVVDVLAVHETFFFRDHAPFQQLEKEIIPSICAEAEKSSRPIRIWSAGSSTGQEAYSIAILFCEIAPHLAKRVQIVGSDVSSKVLKAAAQGIYRKFEVSRGVSEERLDRFFDPHEGAWRVSSRIREMVEWKKFSLAGAWPLLPPFDLVLLRNVMVYFKPETREQILNRVVPVMNPTGRLVVGSAESLMSYEHPFQPVTSMNATYHVLPNKASSLS